MSKDLSVIPRFGLFAIIMLLLSTAFLVNGQSTLSLELDSQEVAVPTKDGFPLMADYFQGDKDSGGVLLLHGCQNSRTVYSRLGKILTHYKLNALALDFRGYGQSTSENFSQRSIKQQAQDIVSYQAEMMKITNFWTGDVIAAHQYLSDKSNPKHGIAVISMGCAIEQTIALAEHIRISAMVALTPKISEIDKERYKNLLDFPVYFIASAHSTDSFNAANELFQWNGDNNSKFQSIKGDRSASTILRRFPEISQDIAIWLKSKSLSGQ